MAQIRLEGISILRSLIPFFRKYGVPLSVGFAFMIVQNYGYVKVPSYVQALLDEIAGDNRPREILSLLGMSAVYTVVTGVALYAMRKLIIGVSRRIEYELRDRIHGKLLRLDRSFFLARETGDLMSRTTNDLNDVRTLMGPGVMYIPNSVSRLALFLPVLFGLSGRLMLMISCVMVFPGDSVFMG